MELSMASPFMDADLVVAVSEDGQVRSWHVVSGTTYPPLPLESGDVPAYTLGRPSGVEVWLGGRHKRMLVTQYAGRVTAWDLTDPSSPTHRAEASFPDVRAFDVRAVAQSGRVLVATLENPERVGVTVLQAGSLLFATRISGATSVLFIDAPKRPLLGRLVRVRGTQARERPRCTSSPVGPAVDQVSTCLRSGRVRLGEPW
jgi:hypothetical protein